MKLSEYKEYITERTSLVKISVINTFHQDNAYIGEKWGNLLSTAMYTVTYLLFIHVLYENVQTIASYTKNEMLFFTFIGQISFYTLWTLSMENYRNLIIDVNKGNLDLILVKPVPALFYVSLRKISILTILRDGIPTLFIVSLIQWQELQLHILPVVAGIAIFICGQLTINAFQFLFTLPAFWFGEARELFGISFDFVTEQMPFEGLNNWLKVLFTTLIPTYFSTSVATSVMLEKSNVFIMIFLSLSVASLMIILKQYLWQVALRSYTSASS